MAVLSGTFLTPVLAHDASESAFVTGCKVECVSNQCCSSRSALPVCVKAGQGPEIVDFVAKQERDGVERGEVVVGRRGALVGLSLSAAALSALAFSPENASAVQQNQLPGRIPGLSEPDSNGLRTYRRPDQKSGGHGVGWSPMSPYSFKVPQDWEEFCDVRLAHLAIVDSLLFEKAKLPLLYKKSRQIVEDEDFPLAWTIPVSIADLGGTEIDLRFQSAQEGNISVVVAPVLRFSSTIGDNATIEAVGTPDMVISAFGPEITGQNVEGKVKSTDVKKYNGRTYYLFELDGPHMLVAATAAGNRLYLMSVSANGRQWKKYAPALKEIVDSFRVA